MFWWRTLFCEFFRRSIFVHASRIYRSYWIFWKSCAFFDIPGFVRRRYFFGLVLRWRTFSRSLSLYIVYAPLIICSWSHNWGLALYPWLRCFPHCIFIQLLYFLSMLCSNVSNFLHLIFESFELHIFFIDLTIKHLNFLGIVSLHRNIVFLHLTNFFAEFCNLVCLVVLF